MNTVLQILMKIGLSLLTEKVLRELLAIGLEKIVTSTANTIDNDVAKPVINALRGN
jgi:hypothetical protein